MSKLLWDVWTLIWESPNAGFAAIILLLVLAKLIQLAALQLRRRPGGILRIFTPRMGWVSLGFLTLLGLVLSMVYGLIQVETVLATILGLVGMCFWGALLIAVTYVFALYEFCFTFVKEGTVVDILRGNTFDHSLMSFRGHYLNDPRRSWFDPARPAWEVLQNPNPNKRKSVYPRFSIWRIPERFGIYFYGLWPLLDIDLYRFRWSEEKTNRDTGIKEQWVRDEPTKIVFVATFVYWVKLVDAKDTGNLPLNLDYLLSVRINNPYKARFTVTNWLDLLTADANNAAKLWVGSHTFEEINREKTAPGAGGVSGFSTAINVLNTSLPTFGSTAGAPDAFGVTVVAASLQEVKQIGGNQEAIAEATTAEAIAIRKANARRAEALGLADARRTAALGEADAINTLAKAERKRVKMVYTEVAKHGEVGVMMRHTEAIGASGQNPGTTIVWANDPTAALIGRFFGRSTTTPPPPPLIAPP